MTVPCNRSGHLNGSDLEPAEMRDFYVRGNVTISENGCYIWGRSLHAAGYGQVYVKGRGMTLAHRRAWELANKGVLGSLDVVCHQCDNPPCVNPAHLEVGDHARNIREAIERGLAKPGEYNRKKNRCIRGHEYSAANTYVRPDGTGRVCKKCRAIWTANYHARKATNGAR